VGIDRETLGPLGVHTQVIVYFPGRPEIDHDRLTRFLATCDESDDRLYVIQESEDLFIPEDPAAPREVPPMRGAAVAAGTFKMLLVYHDTPSPDETLENPQIPDGMREKLSSHQGFVIVSLMGGDDEPLVERGVVLLKVACGLMEQGALGFGMPDTGLAFTSEFMTALMMPMDDDDDDEAEGDGEAGDDERDGPPMDGQAMASMMRDVAKQAGVNLDDEMEALLEEIERHGDSDDDDEEDEESPEEEDEEDSAAEEESDTEEEDEDGEEDEEEAEQPRTFWDFLRHDYEPGALLANIVLGEVGGHQWLFTRGHAIYGLPDLAYQVRSDNEDMEEMAGHIRSAFVYMMENGPILTAGQTFGYDENALIGLHDPSPEDDWLDSPYGTLILRYEDDEK